MNTEEVIRDAPCSICGVSVRLVGERFARAWERPRAMLEPTNRCLHVCNIGKLVDAHGLKRGQAAVAAAHDGASYIEVKSKNAASRLDELADEIPRLEKALRDTQFRLTQARHAYRVLTKELPSMREAAASARRKVQRAAHQLDDLRHGIGYSYAPGQSRASADHGICDSCGGRLRFDGLCVQCTGNR